MKTASQILTELNDDNTKRLQYFKKLVSYSKRHNDPLEKFTLKFFVQYFDVAKLSYLSEVFSKHNEITLEQFIFVMSLMIEHEESETIFLLLGLFDLYYQIKQDIQLTQQFIKYKDFTNFLSEKISDPEPGLIIPLKDTIYEGQTQNVPVHERPYIFYHEQEILPKISLDDLKKSKGLNSLKPISQICYAASLNKILALGRLESSIEIFDIDFNLWNKITPKESIKMKKQFPILSFSFSEEYKCIGCIVKGIGIVFLDYYDRFESQKTIKNASGDKIHFFNTIKKWGVLDEDRLNIWNIRNEEIEMTIKFENGTKINCFCQITSLGLVAFGYTLNDESKWIYMVKIEQTSYKIVSKKQILNSACNRIFYNRYNEALLILGYKNSVPILQIDSTSFDLYPVDELKGHRSIVTSVTSIGSSIVVTGDDAGIVRVWDLKYIRCLQVIKLAKEISQLHFCAGYLLFCDRRLNSISIEKGNIKEQKQQKIILSIIDNTLSTLYIFTKKSCHLIDLATGNLKQIHVLCSDQDVTVAKKYKNCFYIGTSKGCLLKYDFDFKKKGQYHIHQADITQMYVTTDGMFITVSNDTTLKIWISSPTFEIESKTLTHLPGDEQITILNLSEQEKLMLFSSGNEILYLCQFQSLKIVQRIQFQSNIISVLFVQPYSMFLVTCENGSFNCLSFCKYQHEIYIEEEASIYIKKVTLEQGQYWEKMAICQKDKLLLGSSKGQLVKINIDDLFQGQNSQVFRKKQKNYTGVFGNGVRPISQSFQNSLKKSLKTKTSLRLSVSLEPLIFGKIGEKSIKEIYPFQNRKIFIVRQDKLIKVMNLANFKLICQTQFGQHRPNKWAKLQKHHDNIEKYFFQFLKLIKKIQKLQDKTVEFRTFRLIKEQQILRVKRQLNEIYNFSVKKEITSIQTPPEIQENKVIQKKKSLSIKQLEIYKRVKSIKEQKKEEKRSEQEIQAEIKVKKQNLQQLRVFTDFFRPTFRNKFRALSTPETENENKLYNRIKAKIQGREKSQKLHVLTASKIKRLATKEFLIEKRKSKRSLSKEEIFQQLKQIKIHQKRQNDFLRQKFYKYGQGHRQKLKQLTNQEPQAFTLIRRQMDHKLKKARKKMDKL